MRAIQLALRASRVSPQSIYLRQSRVMFSSEGKGILSDPEQQGGKRKLELDEEAAGRIAFNQDAIIPDGKQGTYENPILVPSGMSMRVVGYENPNSHQLEWFNLKKGPVHFVPTIGLFFKMQPIA